MTEFFETARLVSAIVAIILGGVIIVGAFLILGGLVHWTLFIGTALLVPYLAAATMLIDRMEI